MTPSPRHHGLFIGTRPWPPLVSVLHTLSVTHPFPRLQPPAAPSGRCRSSILTASPDLPPEASPIDKCFPSTRGTVLLPNTVSGSVHTQGKEKDTIPVLEALTGWGGRADMNQGIAHRSM